MWPGKNVDFIDYYFFLAQIRFSTELEAKRSMCFRRVHLLVKKGRLQRTLVCACAYACNMLYLIRKNVCCLIPGP